MNSASNNALEVGTIEQLLIDDHVVEDMWDLKRRPTRPLRHPANPILYADKPWDGRLVPRSVLYDDRTGLFRMYYQAFNVEAWQYQFSPELKSRWNKEKHGSSYFTCYAESEDGIRWQKPILDIEPWRSFEHTNIISTGRVKSQAPSVVLNPDPEDSRRFIMIYRDRRSVDGGDQRYFAYSENGVLFTGDENNPVIEGASDDTQALCWDHERRLWYMFIRPPVLPFDRQATDRWPIGNLKRRMAVSTSPDLRNWTFPRTVIHPDELDPTPMCIDTWTVFKHGSHFIALLSIMDETQGGVSHVEVASSPDGTRWTRLPDRVSFFDRGPEGSFDAGQVAIVAPPIEMGDEWWLYYRGTPRGQKESWHNLSAAGIAVLPKGHLVGRFAGDRDGFLITRELVIGEKYLQIDCEMNSAGMAKPDQNIRVGIVQCDYEASTFLDKGYFDGFSIEQCDRVSTSSLVREVTWQGNKDLSSLVGRRARLRFHLRNSGVYSFRFVHDDCNSGSH